MKSARAVADAHYAAFNAGDLEALLALQHDDVEIAVDAGTMVGHDAARAYIAGVQQLFPGVVSRRERVVAETADTVVVELRLVNPAREAALAEGRTDDGWWLGGVVCEILRVRDGRLAALRSYYAPGPGDRTGAAEVPSRNAAARLADDQAALRRVATLVARGVPEHEVFAAINEEIAALVGAELTSLVRFEDDDTAVLLAAWDGAATAFPIGKREPLDAELRAVRDEGRASRWGPAELPDRGPFVDDARGAGVRSSVGVPILHDDRVWGVSFVARSRPDPFPADTEARVAGFTELVGTALANAGARGALERLAREQAALRRVAELAARGAPPDAVFVAVATEASALLSDLPTTLLRFEDDGAAVVLATCGGPAGVGTRMERDDSTTIAAVRRTGRAARTDRYGEVGDSTLAPQFGVGASVAAPIVVEGRLWGMLGATAADEPLPEGTEERLEQFTEIAAAALANAESRAQLAASRARVVASADEARRRVQRDVHDGAQQRLVQAVTTLKLAREAFAHRPGDAAGLVDEALLHCQRASAELRGLVRGILPAALSRGGLRAGVESLVADLAMRVDVEVAVPRLPPSVETTAYFVVAETLANVVKHSGASRASVRAVIRNGTLLLEVSDDGRGGADPARGTGLTGLLDRVEAGEGVLSIVSPPGAGTEVSVGLPLPAVAVTPG